MNTYYIIAPTNSDLQHHGILGMKWGVRRYQNEDGTLTAAGKRRHRDINTMTNQELKEYNERYELEKKFNQAKKEDRIKTAKTVAGVVAVAGLSFAGYKFMQNNPNFLKNKMKDAVVKLGKKEADKIVSTMKDVRVSAAKTDFAKAYVNNPAVKVVANVGDSITGRNSVKANQEVVNIGKQQVEKMATQMKQTRINTSKSDFARNYVKTMNKLLPKELQRGIRR